MSISVRQAYRTVFVTGKKVVRRELEKFKTDSDKGHADLWSNIIRCEAEIMSRSERASKRQ